MEKVTELKIKRQAGPPVPSEPGQKYQAQRAAIQMSEQPKSLLKAVGFIIGAGFGVGLAVGALYVGFHLALVYAGPILSHVSAGAVAVLGYRELINR